jgi:hypothetical protein
VNRDLERALTAAARGDTLALAGFGLERLTLAGGGIPPAGYDWEESLTVTGDRTVRLLNRRSIADVSAEPVGEFLDSCSKETLRAVIELLRDSKLDELPPFRVEPTEPRIRMIVAAGGIRQQIPIGVSDPMALEPLLPLLQELDRLASTVRARPRMTLQVGLELPNSARVAKVRLPVTLRLRNSGDTGYWLTHPRLLKRTSPWERASLLFGLKPNVQPGFTPPPIELREAGLEPAQAEERDLLWIASHAEIELSLMGVCEFAAPGLHLARAVYSTYAGEDLVAGRPRLRGCAFSNETEIQVR